jgi:hypothetical protein
MLPSGQIECALLRIRSLTLPWQSTAHLGTAGAPFEPALIGLGARELGGLHDINQVC